MAIGRLARALAFSAALHGLLIYGIHARPGYPLQPGSTTIQARLVPAALSIPEQAAAVHEPPEADPEPALIDVANAPSNPVEPTETADRSSAVEAMPAPEVEVAHAVPESIVPDAPDPVYYPAKDLDLYPQLLSALQTGYPETARAQRLAGRVTLLVMVNESGRVTEVSVVDAEPPEVFEDAARNAFFAAAFSPAQRAGGVVRSRILVSVEFIPDQP